MIYTLEYIKKEAENIASYWNGKDETFIGGDGEIHTDEQAQVADDLLKQIAEVEATVAELNL